MGAVMAWFQKNKSKVMEKKQNERVFMIDTFLGIRFVLLSVLNKKAVRLSNVGMLLYLVFYG